MQKQLLKQLLNQTPSSSLKQVILTDTLDKHGLPVRPVNQFTPNQTIICWVELTTARGWLEVRWFHEDSLIFEHTDQFLQTSYTFIQSTPQAALAEGAYRVEIYTAKDQPLEIIQFTVKRYKPNIAPTIIIPEHHQDLEDSPFVTIPFVFDEQWQLNEAIYDINQVQIVMENKADIYVSVTVKTTLNPGALTSYQTKRICKPIAHYALTKGYISQAKQLQIDGQYYALEELIGVTLVNREAGVIPGIGWLPIRRTIFEVNDLYHHRPGNRII